MTIIGTQASGVKASKLETELTEIDAGVLKDIPAKTLVTLNGTAMTPAQIDAQAKSYLATMAAADTAKAQYQAALVARRNIQVEARDFYLQLKKVVVAYFGAQSAQLADFGLTPAKAKVPKTSAETAIIAAKAKLTRQARGTTGKKQKAAINPGSASPALAIGTVGNAVGRNITPPTVVDAPLPGSTNSTATGTAAGSTPQTSAGNTNSASAPAATGSGASGSNA